MPKIIYKNKKGQRLPSVTTIIGQNLGWSATPLQYWWWKQGIIAAVKCVKEDIKGNIGMILNQPAEEYAQDIRISTNWRAPLTKAATIGSAAHDKIDKEHKFEQFEKEAYDLTDEEWVKVDRCYDAWCRWTEQTKLQVMESEFSLVSEQYQYGGTLDAKVAEVNGAVSLLDLKTCDGVYESHKIQLAAYGQLINETTIYKIEQYHIIQIKKNGAFVHHNWLADDLKPCWQAFVLLRQLHDLKKQVGAV